MTVKTKNEFIEMLKQAMEEKSPESIVDVLAEMAMGFAEDKAGEMVSEYVKTNDGEVLQLRGYQPLTTKETEFYEKLIEAQRNGTIKEQITNIDAVMPETIIDRVFDDIEQNHPLLSHLDIQHVNAKIKVLYTTADTNIAVWGKLTDAITEELAYGFEELDAGLLKLTAYIPVPQAYLDLGPAYIDRLTRTYLYEAVAKGIEKAVVTNLIDNKGPIAMTAKLDAGTTASGVTTYTEKTAIAVTEWTPKGLANAIKPLTKTRKGNSRPVGKMFCVVNPTDYYTLIMPAICVQNASGDWVIKQPYPIDFVQSEYVTANTAILGIDKRYILGMANDTKGKIETSDEFKFLDDLRTYKIKLYGNGRAKDNTSFVKLNIKDLKECMLLVANVTNNVTVPSAEQGS